MLEAENESRLQKLRKARGLLVVTLVPLLLMLLYLSFHSTGRAADVYRTLWIGLFVVTMNLLDSFHRRNPSYEIAVAYRVHTLEIDTGGLRVNGKTWSRFISRDEVTRVDEPPNGRGMYVRTRRPFSWFLIPRRNDRYEEIKSELAAMGIPIVRKSAPWNWGFLFVFLFCATLLCNLLTQDRRILAVNFVFALIVGGAGAFKASIENGDRRLRRLSLLGSFLPAALSAVSLVFPFGIR